MSLCITLYGPPKTESVTCHCCGYTHEEVRKEEYFYKKITHNLAMMANQSGIYYALWRPEEVIHEEQIKAKHLITRLQGGLNRLTAHPEKFKEFNPENGWGNYEHLVDFVTEYLQACRDYPEADVYTSR